MTARGVAAVARPGRTVVVVGASRGLGRGIARALDASGATVIALARSGPALAELAGTATGVRPEVADATDERAATRIVERHRPDSVIVVAGTVPPLNPLPAQTWESFSANWTGDVRIAFVWLQAALRAPLPTGGRVVVVSSGAAIGGSPLSGGYAGAKATQRFMTHYAQDESDRAGLGITFTAVLPRITPLTDVGLEAVAAYAERGGESVEQYLAAFGELLTPDGAGAAMVDLLGRADPPHGDFLLAGAGLAPLP